MNDIFFTALIVSVVEFIKRALARFTKTASTPNGIQISGEGTIVLSGVVGAVLGLAGSTLGVPQINPAVGFGLGLAAAGVHQVASAAGGK